MQKKELFQPVYSTKVEGTDIMVPMRDGVRLAIDVYRPDSEGRFPALLSEVSVAPALADHAEAVDIIFQFKNRECSF